jgi:hypothetical protein
VQKVAGSKRNWQVSFFINGSQSEVATVPESACRHLEDEVIDEQHSPLDIYDAYKLARKEQARLKAHKDSSEDITLDSTMWTTNDLRDFLNGLMGGVRGGKLRGGAVPFQPREEECGIYLREGFCQKLNYLLKECSLEKEL